MNRLSILISALILSLGCRDKESIITIIDIGNNDRGTLGKQIGIINKYSPKLLALDFFLIQDSSDIDNSLVRELSKNENTVQCVALYKFKEHLNYWDSLDISNSKFKIKKNGFSNITITDDSVFIPELPMSQYYRNIQYRPLSYVIAENSFGVKEKYKNVNRDKDFVFEGSEIGHFFKILTYEDLIKGNFKKEDIKDKIVIMGYVGGQEDSFYLNPARTKKISGVEIHACIVRQLIDID